MTPARPRRPLPFLLAVLPVLAPVGVAAHPPVPVEAVPARPAASRPDDPATVWAESLARRYASCFTAMGPVEGRVFPTAAREPDPQRVVARADLPVNSMVSDGYRHRLLVDGPGNAVYVVQVGGFAGARTVYGPLPVDLSCAPRDGHGG